MFDNGVNYFYFCIEIIFWKFCYVNIWAIMNDLCDSVMVGNIFVKKYMFMYYLSVNIGKCFNFGFFEGIMWGDEFNCYGFDFSFFNFVIFYCFVEFV